MNRYLRWVSVVAVMGIAVAACGGDGGPGDTGPTTTGPEIQAGGTLKAALLDDVFYGFDPTREYYTVSWEVLRCCLARTLQSYAGKPGAEGSVLFPDLAAADPEITEDQLTWTWTLKDGISFGDPIGREIVAADFVTAVNRIADPEGSEGGYPFYYSPIVGFDEAFDSDEVNEVTGAVAVDEKTFQIQLEQPTGDLGFMFAMPAGAPLPAEAVEAHPKDYGQFMVSSGPYQYEGMADIDVTDPKADPPTGMDIGKSYVLERNPNWSADTDELRPAYVDRIEIQVGGDTQDLLDQVDAGVLDLCIDCGATSTTIQKYTQDPALADRLQVFDADALAYSSMNVFEPPFDDVFVRRAVNWAIDKSALLRVGGGDIQGTIAGHFVPNSLLEGVLVDYDPFATPDSRGDLEAAKQEMIQSAYDSDGDGVCDHASCENVLTLSVADDPDVVRGIEVWTSSLEPLGINLDVKFLDISTMYTRCSVLATHAAFCPNVGWAKDYPSPFTFFLFTLGGGEGCCNYSFTGTNEDALTKEGYAIPTDGVLNLDEDIDACRSAAPEEAAACWADLDRRVTEELALQVPRRFANNIDVLGERIVNYSFDQFASVGAIDHLALVNGGA